MTNEVFDTDNFWFLMNLLRSLTFAPQHSQHFNTLNISKRYFILSYIRIRIWGFIHYTYFVIRVFCIVMSSSWMYTLQWIFNSSLMYIPTKTSRDMIYVNRFGVNTSLFHLVKTTFKLYMLQKSNFRYRMRFNK